MSAKRKRHQPPRILMTSLDGNDYIAPIINIADVLRERGNQIFIAGSGKNRNSIETLGFKFISFESVDPDYVDDSHPGIPCLGRSMNKVNMPPLERLNCWTGDDTQILLSLLRELMGLDKLIRLVVKKVKPDLIIADTIFPPPIFFENKIPCIPVYSVNPLGLYKKYGLPAGTGFSVNGDKEIWVKYWEKEKAINDHISLEFNYFYSSHGLQVTDMNEHRLFARHFGIYIYPEPLDYTELGLPPSNWVRMDPFLKKPIGIDLKYLIPEKFILKQGKLIYLCIGTATRVHIAIINRLINTFSKSKHRFIVNTSPSGEKLTLHENMCAFERMNEMDILPEVDLVIAHGHNDMVSQCLYFAKPMMIMPLFFNQLDNAQRFEDLKIGVRVNPTRYDEAEINDKVDQMLEDTELHSRILQVSKKLQKEKNHSLIAQMIEFTARTHSSPLDNDAL